MSDVPKQQAPLVINTPYKPNTLGAHTAPQRARAPPLPRGNPTTPPRENINNPFKRTAGPAPV
jgi:hypothetical protein